MRGKTFPDRIEVYLSPEEIIFAPAPTRTDDTLKKSGIAIGSLIAWFAWAWMRYKYPQVLRGKEKHCQELSWDGEKFIATFREDIPE